MINRIIVFFILLRSLIASVCISESKMLEGTWRLQAELSGLVSYAVSCEAPEFADYISIDSLPLSFVAEFYSDGSYYLYADRSSAYAAYELVLPHIKEAAMAYISDQISFGGFGMSAEDFLSISGINLDDLISQHLGPDVVEELLLMAESRGFYEAEDGKLYLFSSARNQEQYLSYTLNGDSLTITGGTAIGMIYGVDNKYITYLCPMTLTRQGEAG